jgi:hypothetical protein
VTLIVTWERSHYNAVTKSFPAALNRMRRALMFRAHDLFDRIAREVGCRAAADLGDDAVRLMITCQVLLLERGQDGLDDGLIDDQRQIVRFVLGEQPRPADLRAGPALTAVAAMAARLLRESDLDPAEVTAIADQVIAESGDELERLRDSLRAAPGARRDPWWRRRPF